MASKISERTGIASECLNDGPSGGPSRVSYLETATVAQKLSWMSTRVTTRDEDMAYCLLGLLDVNMPLLYGEGGVKAFQRLQFAFILQSPDESLFAWGLTHTHAPGQSGGLSGCIAKHPKQFKGASHVSKIHRLDPHFVKRPPYLATNQGISFTSPAIRLKAKVKQESLLDSRSKEYIEAKLNEETYLLPLNCNMRAFTLAVNDHKGWSNDQCMIAVKILNGVACRMRGTYVESGFEDADFRWHKGKTETIQFLLGI